MASTTDTEFSQLWRPEVQYQSTSDVVPAESSFLACFVLTRPLLGQRGWGGVGGRRMMGKEEREGKVRGGEEKEEVRGKGEGVKDTQFGLCSSSYKGTNPKWRAPPS